MAMSNTPHCTAGAGMKYHVFWGINLIVVGTITPSWFGAAQVVANCIVPAYAIKKSFDKETAMPPATPTAAAHHCPVTVGGNAKAFIGCTVNGAMHLDGAGNTHTVAEDPALAAVNQVLGKKEEPGFISKYLTAGMARIRNTGMWVSNHQLITTGMGIAALYVYSWMRVAHFQRYITSSNGWGSWHTDCNWETLSAREQAQLREELLVEVRNRYPLVHDAVPVHCFMNDVEKEIAFYTSYMTFVSRVQRLDRVRRFITDRFRDAYSGLLGNTHRARVRAEELFEYTALGKWLRVNEHTYALCVKKRDHLMNLKAFYAEWLTTVRAIYKQKK